LIIHTTEKDASLNTIALIIFAQNESNSIQSTVRAARQALRPGDALMVVADNCSDDTAMLAKKEGAEIYIRNQTVPRGKGAAMAWFAQNHPARLAQYSYLVILDADSQVKPDFLAQLEQRLPANVEAAQCFISPLRSDETPLSRLIALSDIVEQNVFDRIKTFFGWSVRLRGTGIVIRPQLLREVSRQIGTEVEDIVLSLLIAEKGVVVRSIPTVAVYDPKPSESDSASRQRARWFRGQWAAFWDYRYVIFRLLAAGPGGWSTVVSLFLKPRWLKLTLMTALGLALFKLPAIALTILSLVALEGILFLVGTLMLPDRNRYLKALLFLPGFIWMWFKGILLSLRSTHWLSARSPIRYSQDAGAQSIIESTR
jgi:cellulose synthase/poly-beta-1,6-N-acetylglucosamine synthase-like glycosyltransferase